MIEHILSVYGVWGSMNPWVLGFFVWAWIFLLIVFVMKVFPRSAFSLLMEEWYEQVYNFFLSMLPEEKNAWIVKYVTIIFFLILIFNLVGLVFDPLASISWFDELMNEFNLSKFVTLATGDIHFNASISAVSIAIMLYAQWWAMKTTVKNKWLASLVKIWKTVYEYLPIFGKDLVSIERGDMSRWLYILISIPVKLFDIAISLFVWILDIIGLGAKILSLAARLFGNMMAWGILSKLLIVWAWAIVWWLITKILWTEVNFPFLLPLIVYIQWLLVALIQAFVFPLLIAIFIKVAQGDDGEEAPAGA